MDQYKPPSHKCLLPKSAPFSDFLALKSRWPPPSTTMVTTAWVQKNRPSNLLQVPLGIIFGSQGSADEDAALTRITAACSLGCLWRHFAWKCRPCTPYCHPDSVRGPAWTALWVDMKAKRFLLANRWKFRFLSQCLSHLLPQKWVIRALLLLTAGKVSMQQFFK